MDLHRHPPRAVTIQPPVVHQAPASSISDETSFPILAISIVGILATAILLLSYYIFVIKCCLNASGRSDVIRHLSRSRRRWQRTVGQQNPLANIYLSAVADQGLEEAAIQAIPALRFRRAELRNSFHECVVCLNEFQEEERIRMLPNCLHVFHIDCIDTWLQTHANCPLCRAGITRTSPLPIMLQSHSQQEHVVIDMVDQGSDRQALRGEASSAGADPSSVNSGVDRKDRKPRNKVASMGDECIDLRGEDKQFTVAQPMRRSFSMDSSTDGQLFMAVQEILRQNPHFREAGNGEGTSSTGPSGRTRRSFFSFGGHCRSWRSSVLQLKQNQEQN